MLKLTKEKFLWQPVEQLNRIKTLIVIMLTGSKNTCLNLLPSFAIVRVQSWKSDCLNKKYLLPMAYPDFRLYELK